MTVLSNWGIEEIDEKLGQRVEFTRRALSKLVQVFDKLSDKNQHLITLISGENENLLHLSSIKGKLLAKKSIYEKMFTIFYFI